MANVEYNRNTFHITIHNHNVGGTIVSTTFVAPDGVEPELYVSVLRRIMWTLYLEPIHTRLDGNGISGVMVMVIDD